MDLTNTRQQQQQRRRLGIKKRKTRSGKRDGAGQHRERSRLKYRQDIQMSGQVWPV